MFIRNQNILAKHFGVFKIYLLIILNSRLHFKVVCLSENFLDFLEWRGSELSKTSSNYMHINLVTQIFSVSRVIVTLGIIYDFFLCSLKEWCSICIICLLSFTLSYIMADFYVKLINKSKLKNPFPKLEVKIYVGCMKLITWHVSFRSKYDIFETQEILGFLFFNVV